MGDRLSGGNTGLALLANSLATGAGLIALILTFGPVSGAHFNPAVSIAVAWEGGLAWATATRYVLAQMSGAVSGVVVAHAMFGEPLLMASHHARSGWPQAMSEAVATFGLLSVIASCSRRQPAIVAFAVGAYITGAYWFTASTSFANPAVTIARTLTDTFAGIRPADAPMFVAAQAIGAAAAASLWRWLLRPDDVEATS
jgi:glycerol uptake facilitator-like aquaporin